jgi:hypothetical protein
MSSNDEVEAWQQTCQRCRREIHPGRGESYIVSIIAVADPSPPSFTEDDLARDVEHEVQSLLKRMRNLDAQQAQEQVYRRMILYLCASCYGAWIADPTGSVAC